MLEEILTYMSTVSPLWIYFILFFFAFIENFFPPSPSDVVVVVGSTLIASTSISFIPILLITSIGSATGFILMYFVGKFFGRKVIRSGRIKFISPESLAKPDEWFSKYGYKLIIANRFLPGTRAVISFFAGIHKLNTSRTFFLASISSFLWYTLLVVLGMEMGNNVELLDYYLSTYSNIILGITFLVLLFLGLRKIRQNRIAKSAKIPDKE